MISTGDQQLIDNVDAHIRQVLALKDICNTYALGNVYVIESGNPPQAHCNQMGEPDKYQVTHVSPMGMPFLQRLSSNGNPFGDVQLPPEAEGLRWTQLGNVGHDACRFVQDPDQLDAIMLQQEYDPMRQHNDKLKLKLEVNKYNKSILVPTNYRSYKVYTDFLKNLKQGDKFWTSMEKQYVVYAPAQKIKNKWIITVLNPDQQEEELQLSDFANKRLYESKPRSFAKEVQK